MRNEGALSVSAASSEIPTTVYHESTSASATSPSNDTDEHQHVRISADSKCDISAMIYEGVLSPPTLFIVLVLMSNFTYLR